MKSTNLNAICVFLISLIISTSFSTTIKSKLTLQMSSKSLLGTSLTQNELANIWADLFSANRGQSCKAEAVKKQALAAVIAQKNGMPGQKQGKKAGMGTFGWIKNWGYGETAYLIDFLDPIFQKDIISQFKKLYTDVMSLPSADSAEYSDLLDIKKLVSPDNAHLLKKGKVDFKTLNKNYDPNLYNISANSVQLRAAIKAWNWFTDPGQLDYAVDFIMKYDINGDGRLNARELILGAIDHNKNSIGMSKCQNCFQDIAKKLDAIFIYLDCNNDGLLSAENLWNSLPNLQRGETRWNIFGINNSDNIRTSAINDFCIKNGLGKEGSLNKDEWRNGVLFAYWDRQTNEKGIVEDDSRNLKSLRWSEGGLTDTVAYNYMKEKVLANLIAKSQK
jgi:hypothetical protein